MKVYVKIWPFILDSYVSAEAQNCYNKIPQELEGGYPYLVNM